jgi:hypothetical protein
MAHVSTQTVAPRDKELKSGPKCSSVDLILAFSKSLEVKRSASSKSVFLNLN